MDRDFELYVTACIDYEAQLWHVLTNIHDPKWREENHTLHLRDAFVRMYLLQHVGHARFLEQNPEKAITYVLSAAKWCRGFSTDVLESSQMTDYVAATLSSFYSRASIYPLMDKARSGILRTDIKEVYKAFLGAGISVHVNPERSREAAKAMFHNLILERTSHLKSGDTYAFPVSDLKEIVGRPMTNTLSIAAATHFNHPPTVEPLYWGLEKILYRVL